VRHGSTEARGTFLEVLAVFARLGLTSFGGPVAHLGYLRAECVKRRGWLDDRAYADLVALCQFLPGPASSQVGIGLGDRHAGVPGAFAAWLGFTLPSALLLVGFAFGVQTLGDVEGAAGCRGPGRTPPPGTWPSRCPAGCRATAAPLVLDVGIDQDLRSVVTGETHQLTATVITSGGADEGVTWSSSDPLVALVDATGLVGAIATGEVTVPMRTLETSTDSSASRCADGAAMLAPGEPNQVQARDADLTMTSRTYR
jgi:hypothetical protein